jgi:N-acetylmuramoyl-L-alanine amidase
MFSATMVVLLITSLLAGFELFGSNEQLKAEIRIEPPVVLTAPAVTALTATGDFDPSGPLVGIVSGHKGYDSGAVCADGLTEAEVNYGVALEVAGLLERRGVHVDLLDEYDEQLTDYEADALISIHSDSCNIPGATGFKVARVTDSAIPEAEDRLVACLNQEYATYTGLFQHPASITDGMTNYHAFNEITPVTPGAIIETGFMLDDRHLLQYKPKVVARGIAAGILCFLGQ